MVKRSLSKFKILMVLSTLLIFVGQSMASAVMSCHMDTQNQPQNTATSVAAHSGHHMYGDSNSIPESEKVSFECCSQDCKCPISSCTSVMLPAVSHKINAPLISAQKINLSLISIVSQSPSSLYRPPISR